jgi:cytochrome c-type biogenesis protein CcmH/NrfG
MQETIVPGVVTKTVDSVESFLRTIAEYVGIFAFGLLPVLFIPISFIPSDYVKIVLVIVTVCVILIFWSLAALRSGTLSVSSPLMLPALWGVALASVVSALLSGDMRDSFIGDDFGVHTALFFVLMAGVATVISQTGHSKTTIMRLYILCALSTLLISVLHILRLGFGVDFLSFGVLNSLTTSFVGTWNDLALFFGLFVLLSLVALEQLPLTRSGRLFFAAVVVLALIMLAVVNFFAVWIVLALVSLSLLMYGLTKNRFTEKTLTLQKENTAEALSSVLVSMVVFIVSIIFIIGGSSIGGYISRTTGISFLEVRPSLQATIEVGRAVYVNDAFVGVGPNKFVDAWRLHKNDSINETIFWATDFTGGNGFITTSFVQLGILGIAAWLTFFSLFLFAGFRMLFKTTHADRFWYFIGSSSFVGATYIWVMSALYVPGATMLILAALFTGLVASAYVALVPTRTLGMSISSNRKVGFVLVGFTMLAIIGSTTVLYYVGQHASSVYTFGKAINSLEGGADIKGVEEKIAQAYETSQNELYALQVGSYQLAKINVLSQLETLTPEQQKELQSSISNGINAGQIVVSSDKTDPRGWSLLSAIYSVLAGASVEGAKERAFEALTQARGTDPKNPAYLLSQAQLNARTNDIPAARALLVEAIAMKPNYTDALFFLTQLDIFEGKTDDAIKTTLAIISLEPNNPARYYQLGVLQSAAQKLDEAIASFAQAVSLDANYANARYFLALGLAEKGDTKGALEQLEAVLVLNPGNTEIEALIEALKSGKLPSAAVSGVPNAQVSEPNTVTTVDNTVTSTEAPDTPLVSPVNTVAADGTPTAEGQ